MTKDKFSLFDFCKKNTTKKHLYGSEMLDENGEPIPFLDQAAIITHYLKLKESGIEVSYAEQAEKLMASWNEIIRKEYGHPIIFCT